MTWLRRALHASVDALARGLHEAVDAFADEVPENFTLGAAVVGNVPDVSAPSLEGRESECDGTEPYTSEKYNNMGDGGASLCAQELAVIRKIVSGSRTPPARRPSSNAPPRSEASERSSGRRRP